MLYIRGHKIIKGYIGNTPISHVGFGKSGLIKIKSENGGSDYPNNLIAKYTANTSGVLPTFNSGYQYTVNETESNGVYTVEISSDSDFTSCTFSGKTQLLTVDYLKVTNKVTTMANLFSGCTSLTRANTNNFDTSNVTSMYIMFQNCNNLTSLDVSKWDTKNVTNMFGMFQNCSNLIQLDVSKWYTGNVKDMASMFFSCSSLTQLDVSNWDTSNATNMGGMFFSCSSLTQLDVSNWDTKNVTSMGYMFSSCLKLIQLDLNKWDTKNVTSMGSMFDGCKSLTSLDVSNFDTSKVANMSGFIVNASALQSFISCAIPVSFGANGTALTHDSLMSIINNLVTVTKTQTLTLGSTNLAKLTDTEKAIATNKGWTLA